MDINKEDITKLEELLYKCWGDVMSARMSEQETCHRYLTRNPHLLFSSGFTEARVFHKSSENDRLLSKRFNLTSTFGSLEATTVFRHENGEWYLLGDIGWPRSSDSPKYKEAPSDVVLANRLISRLRDEEWWLELARQIPVIQFWNDNLNANGPIYVEIDDFIRNLKGRISKPLGIRSISLHRTGFSCPGTLDSLELIDATQNLVLRIQEGSATLAELSPSDLEDLVAELMRDRGHNVLRVK